MPNTYVALATQTLGTATSSVTFSSISANYTDLVLVVSAGNPTNDSGLLIRFNGDTASNYSDTSLYGDGSSAVSFRTSSATGMNAGRTDTGISTNIINVQNYSNTTTNKTAISRGNDGALVIATTGLWRSTAAINSVTIYDQNGRNFNVGSTFSIYGVANANQGAAKATGGMITEDSQYYYHTFGASGAFIPKQSLTCDVLVVAGGGGAAGQAAGGAGAGGLVWQSGRSTIATSYSVTVGAGGIGANSGAATAGGNSVFDTITAIGGAPAQQTSAGQSGGSGSGAAYTAGGGGAATQGNSGGGTGYGNAGGNGLNSASQPAGGGGGAGGAGQSYQSGSQAGNGGVGLSGLTIAALNSIGTVTGTGQLSGGNYYYAGGGGGGIVGGTGVGIGGLGGGGNGGQYSNNVAGTNGTANTGGGAGGGGAGGDLRNGGSGLVIVRYLKA